MRTFRRIVSLNEKETYLNEEGKFTGVRELAGEEIAAHVALPDPHSQYQKESNSVTTEILQAHVDESNPHTQYVLQAGASTYEERQRGRGVEVEQRHGSSRTYNIENR
jgi:hypothetical protein